jgi:hypothetical protein
MAHPIAVVPSTDGEKHNQTNKQLANIGLRMQASKCKGIWTFPEDVGAEREYFDLTSMVNLSSVQRGYISRGHRYIRLGVPPGRTQLEGQLSREHPAAGRA